MPLRPRSIAAVHDPLRPRRWRGPDPAQGYRFNHGWVAPFPELPAFTHVNQAVCTPDHVLAPHRHPHLEICYFHAGRAEWTIAGRRHRLRPGDFFLAWPGERHSGRPDPADPNHNFAVGFDPARLPVPRALLGDAADLDSAHAQTVALRRLRVVRGGHGAERLFRSLLHECDAAVMASADERALCLAQVQALLVELFVLVCRCGLHGGTIADPALDGFVDWLETRVAEPPSVAEMAAWSGLSPAQLTRRCRAAWDATPLELMTRLRIDAARRRFAAEPGVPVTEVAYALGFCSSQYFATVFRRVTGFAPSVERGTS